MQHADGRRSGRRRALVAVITAAMTLAAVLAVTPRRGPWNAAPPGARRPGDRHRELRRQGSRRGRDHTERPDRAGADPARARLGSLGVMGSDPTTGTLRFVGRLDGYLTGRHARPASGHPGLRPVEPRRVRTHGGRPGDAPPPEGLRGHRGHPPPLVDASGGVEVFRNGLRASVTGDGRLLNVTGSPVHVCVRVASTVSRHGIRRGDPRRVSGGAPRLAAATLRLPPRSCSSRRPRGPTRVGDPTSPSTQQLDLSVVDATSGRRRCTAEPAPATRRHRDRVGALPRATGAGGGGAAVPVTFPVADGSRLFGNNAHACADVNDDDQARGERGHPRSCGLDWSGYAPSWTRHRRKGCTTHRPCTWDSDRRRSAGRPTWRTTPCRSTRSSTTFHDHLKVKPIGFTEAAGNFQQVDRDGARARAATPSRARPPTAPTPAATGSRTPTIWTTPTCATPPTGRRRGCRCTCSRSRPGVSRTWSSRQRRRRRRGRVPRVHARAVEPAGHLLDGPRGLNNHQAFSMGEAWSDWYALDYLNEQGFKPDIARATATSSWASCTFAGRPPVAAGRLPGERRAQATAPAPARPAPAATRTATWSRSTAARGARRWRDLGWRRSGTCATPWAPTTEKTRHARHGALAAQPVVPGHAGRHPAGRHRRERRRELPGHLGGVRRPGHGLLRLLDGGNDAHPVEDFSDAAGLLDRPARSDRRQGHRQGHGRAGRGVGSRWRARLRVRSRLADRPTRRVVPDPGRSRTTTRIAEIVIERSGLRAPIADGTSRSTGTPPCSTAR